MVQSVAFGANEIRFEYPICALHSNCQYRVREFTASRDTLSCGLEQPLFQRNRETGHTQSVTVFSVWDRWSAQDEQSTLHPVGDFERPPFPLPAAATKTDPIARNMPIP